MKVLFNIKKLQLSKIISTDSAGIPTYDEPLKCPGTVSLTMDTEESSDPFYADGEAYYTPNGAETSTGTLENALFTNDILKAIYSYVEDTNGNMVSTDGQVAEFGIQFACDSDDGEVYFTYYRVTSTKPGLNLTTNSPNATVNPQSVNITASTVTLDDGRRISKSFADKNSGNYANYFDAITLPQFTASV